MLRDGTPAMVVIPHVLTPARAKVADFLAAVCGLGQFVLGLTHMPVLGLFIGLLIMKLGMQTIPEDSVLAVALGGPLLLYPVYKGVFRWTLRKETKLMFTPTLFRVKDKLFWRWSNYDRQVDHSFGLYEHRKKRDELDNYEYRSQLAQRDGKVIRKRLYYNDSYHLCLDYMGQLNKFMTIYGLEEADQVHRRMKQCDEEMDVALNKGRVTPRSPQQQWQDNRPGGSID